MGGSPRCGSAAEPLTAPRRDALHNMAVADLQPLEREPVEFAAEVFSDGLRENRIVAAGVREERHRRSELQVVGMPRDLRDRAPFEGIDEPSTLDEAGPENRMA